MLGVALVVGCACGKPPQAPSASGEQPLHALAAAEGTPPAQLAENLGDEDEVLPAFNDEALAARVEAQRALLGADLFEDIEGNPVSPRIELMIEDGDIGGSVDDDILLSLPGSSGLGVGGDLSGTEDAPTNGNALGLYVPIEEPRDGAALAHFHEALRQLADGVREDKVRIAVYGGSHTQADWYPGYFRVYLQQRFGDGGQGFVALNRVNKWFRYQDWSVDQTRGWAIDYAQKSTGRQDGYYGVLGFSGSSASKRDRTTLISRDGVAVGSDYLLHYLAQPDGGHLELRADGKKIAKIDTGAHEGKDVAAPRAGYHAFTLPEGPHEIEVRVLGDGEVRLFGIAVEKAGPGVVVDTLGISGTRAANMLKWDQGVWADNLAARPPDLYTLFYGTNEATDENQPMSDYRANLREVLRRLRDAAPEASCLLIGPGDFPREVEEDVWVPRPRLLEIVEAQRDIAYDMGCGFWDTLAFMGGVNSMHEWATSQPRMASRDHIHFTKRGYVRLGMGIIDAMMASYDRE